MGGPDPPTPDWIIVRRLIRVAAYHPFGAVVNHTRWPQVTKMSRVGNAEVAETGH
jgi:hypothetical protein